MAGKVLISDKVHPFLIRGLEEMGFTVHYEPEFDARRMPDVIRDLEGIIINSKMRMNESVLHHAKRLNFIGRLGSGLEIIDLEAAENLGIAVLNSPEGNRNAVAEHALGMLLALSNNLLKADSEVRNLEWKREENRGFELDGKTVGIIGFGHTGQSFARKLSGWAVQIHYYDIVKPPRYHDVPDAQSVTLDRICEASDVISLHVPLTIATNRMVNTGFFEKCHKMPVLINTSRGGVVDTKALLRALEKGQVRGACLDVLENENPESYTTEELNLYSSIFALHNVVFTPHIAGWTHESLEKIASTLLVKIKGLYNTDV